MSEVVRISAGIISVFAPALSGLGALALPSTAAAQAPVSAAAPAPVTRHSWSLALDAAGFDADTGTKIAAEPGGGFARAAFAWSGSIRPTLEANVVADAVSNGSSGVDITEAWLEWRPVPVSPLRHSVRVGAFYPPLSLENSEPDWSSPYSGVFSTINSWIGEELRTIGAEWSLSRALGARARQREIGFVAAAWYGNDPAGALLAWRGFALHERQSRLGDALALPAVPQLAPGMMFEAQAPATEPFTETDHRPGFYYGGELQLGRRVLLTALRYDNRADPLSLKDGHYGWRTRFDHFGAQLELPAGLGMIVQWLDGTTAMGPVMAPASPGYHVVDNRFESAFVLLTRTHGRHRWSLRFDDFAVTDRDRIPLDDNDESGDAVTLAWRFEAAAAWSVGFDWVKLDVTRPAYAYASLPPARTETVARLGFRFRAGSTAPLIRR